MLDPLDELALYIGRHNREAGGGGSPRGRAGGTPESDALEEMLLKAIGEALQDAYVERPKRAEQFATQMRLAREARRNELADQEAEFGRRKELMRYEHELSPKENPESLLRGEAAKLAIEGGDLLGAQAVLSGRMPIGGVEQVAQASAPRWEQREAEIQRQYSTDRGVSGRPEWLVEQYGRLMDDIRAQHPGEVGERMARELGERLNRQLHESMPEERVEPFGDLRRRRWFEAIRAIKEKQFGAGRSGISEEQYLTPQIPIPPR